MRPSWRARSCAFTSGTTSGTLGSMRNAEEYDGARRPRRRRELAAACGAGAEEGDINALEGRCFQLLDLVGLALELERLAGRTGRGEQLQGSDGEVPSLEDAEDL